MKIDSSAISMNSKRIYANSTETKQSVTTKQAGTRFTTYSGTSFLFSYTEYNGFAGSRQSGQYDEYLSSNASPDNQELLTSDLYTNPFNRNVSLKGPLSPIEKFQEELVERLERLMERIKNQLLGITGRESGSVLDITTQNQPGTLWTRQNYQSTSVTEVETTTFNSTGSVITADGRSIQFDISMEMSRSFTETVESITQDTQYVLTDPLVIQLDNAPETISSQKWFFDIDGDGKKEEISQLAKGNAFLALDKNGNGKIDDGNELFGTKSGNGFKDLAAYDEDGNGWIDENDSVYSKLKIWVKDASGNDKLMDLKQADIGAIYLGAANTSFTHKTLDSNETQAVVRQTGFYLHESSGAAGTVQQIDFASR